MEINYYSIEVIGLQQFFIKFASALGTCVGWVSKKDYFIVVMNF